MNMSMTEKIKAGKLFTDMCEGLPEKGEPAEFGKNRTLRFSGHP
nr:Galactoside O-acetyltransferase [Klebsiella pneumoniae]